MPLRVVFFGTPSFAVPTLTALSRSAHSIAGVITQPDRPRGRGQKVQPEAVKLAATGSGIPVWQPERLRDPEFLNAMRSLDPDVGVVAAYGRLLPQALLDVPRLGFLNVHASLLPRWRGAAPVHRAILAGDTVTGITIMRVVLALDAGPMLARVSTPIDPDETSVELEDRLAELGAALLGDALADLERGRARDVPQDEREAAYAPKLERADGQLDWTQPARAVHDRIRGLHPWPLAAASLGDRRLHLIRSTVADVEAAVADPGTIIDVARDALVVAAGQGAVRLLDVRPEGRRTMTMRDYLNGTHVRLGDRFR